ncbi:TetR/AcrR family transcriptional regulator [Anoxybacterium hadale]|uniref:TetR/AcrR family transcriptional regulator n=1 Tax=Anoxybacterium hadale TaxID=3408580 RepID=A0ACD1ACU8_9FIRM|nr:TetR/AcrR family transcriptional regulator [Clostridiales bacterium]
MRNREITREKIIRAAIEIGAQEGISAVTTRKIAKSCSIAEGTIFFHFGTIKDLLSNAFMIIDKAKAEALSGIRRELFDHPDERMIAWEIWRTYLDFWLERPLETKYYASFFRSALYDYKVHTATEEAGLGTYVKYRELMEGRKMFDSAYQIIGYVNIWQHIINATLNFANKISDGEIRESEEVKEFIFELIFERLMK